MPPITTNLTAADVTPMDYPNAHWPHLDRQRCPECEQTLRACECRKESEEAMKTERLDTQLDAFLVVLLWDAIKDIAGWLAR